MSNEICIEVDKGLVLEEYVPIASGVLSLIAEAAEGTDEIDETLSVTDLSALLNKISMHMSGEFEIHQTPSNYCQIVYTPCVSNQVAVDEGRIDSEVVDIYNASENCLWINEKVLFAFMDRKFYGFAFALYFYLGHLMTCDAAFAVSHNISFEKILDTCDAFPEDFPAKYRTTLMRAIADLQDAGLIEWNARAGIFELLHITSYDPRQKV